MRIVEESYQRLFDQPCPYQATFKYSGRFKGFNGAIRKRGDSLHVRAGKKWKGVDREILIGLIQHLILRILKRDGRSSNIDLYNHFIKSLHLSVPKDAVDPHLMDSYARVMVAMPELAVDLPNMVWGNSTFRTLAHYRYEDDTITVSDIFQDAPEDMLDYLLYHELLHKKFKFTGSGRRTLHHSAEFRRWERNFPGAAQLEKSMSEFVRKKKRGAWRLW